MTTEVSVSSVCLEYSVLKPSLILFLHPPAPVKLPTCSTPAQGLEHTIRS
jgi:hypothetical protein